MRPFTFVLLATVTAAVAVEAVHMVRDQAADTAPEVTGGAPLVPGLNEHINQVVALTVAGGRGSVTIARSGPDSDRWTVAEKANYPAALDQVRRVILGVDAAKTLEPRTSRPDQYSKLQVDEAGAVHVTLRTADGQAVPTLLVGKAVVAASPEHPVHQFYARRDGEAQSWLAVGQLPSLAIDPMQWVERSLPTVATARVMAVTVSRSGVVPLTISRSDAAQQTFTVADLPAGATAKPLKVNELAAAAEFLAFEDVEAVDPAVQPEADSTVTTIRSFDGLVLTIRLDHRDGKSWARFSAALDPARVTKDATSPGGIDPAQEVKDIQDRTAGWRYRLSDSAAKDLAPSLDDVIDKPAKAETPASAPASAPEPTAAPASAPASAPESTVAPASAPASAPESTVAPASAPASAPEPTAAPAPAPAATPEPTVAPAPASAPASAPESTVAPASVPAATPEPTAAPAAASPTSVAP